jgi:hypothetical protein
MRSGLAKSKITVFHREFSVIKGRPLRRPVVLSVQMAKIIKHIVIPAVAPTVVIGLYFTPVSSLGCVNRGLIALAVVLISLLGGIAAAAGALRLRGQDDAESGWWTTSACILALPSILVLGPLG